MRQLASRLAAQALAPAINLIGFCPGYHSGRIEVADRSTGGQWVLLGSLVFFVPIKIVGTIFSEDVPCRAGSRTTHYPSDILHSLN